MFSKVKFLALFFNFGSCFVFYLSCLPPPIRLSFTAADVSAIKDSVVNRLRSGDLVSFHQLFDRKSGQSRAVNVVLKESIFIGAVYNMGNVIKVIYQTFV